MIHVKSFLELPEGRMPVEEVECYDGDLDYINGSIAVDVDGQGLMSADEVDLVDQLWAYLIDGLRAVALDGQPYSVYFPDQPMPVVFEPRGVLLYARVGEREIMTALDPFVRAMAAAAQHFLEHMARLVGPYEHTYAQEQLEDLLRRIQL